MAPKFKELSEKHLDVVFMKLDCNKENKVCPRPLLSILSVSLLIFQPDVFALQSLAKELGIKVVPTFKILKDGKVVKEVTGAKLDDLVFAIDTVKSSS